jgi:hypothetical protein
MASNGDKDLMHYAWYESRPEIRSKIIPTWQQFIRDVAHYEPAEESPEVVGRSPDQLPALHIEVKGAVTASNLNAFKDHALAVFSGINTDLQTDSDFADAEKTVKWCKDVEGKLDAAKDHALAQTASIDELFRAIDSIKEEARAKRLELEKLVKARKESIRVEIVSAGKLALSEHVAKLNASLDIPIQPPQADFAGAIKGKRTISSLRDAVDTTLAQAKIESSAMADLVRTNLNTIKEHAGDYGHLFADRSQLVTKETDYVLAVIKSRIAEHKEAEEKRIAAERERIRAEEEVKARKAAEAERIAAEREQVKPDPKKPDPVKKAPSEDPRQVKESRPSDLEIIEAISQKFRVHEMVALRWILSIDTKAMESELSKEFAA